jgi:hypothetical protein
VQVLEGAPKEHRMMERPDTEAFMPVKFASGHDNS